MLRYHRRATQARVIVELLGASFRFSVEYLLECMGSVVPLDGCPAEKYALGHLPGTLDIPTGELEQRFGEPTTDVDTVSYCRGPYCVLSTDAVMPLRAHGLSAHRLSAGFPEWKAAGLQMEEPTTRAE